MKIIKPTNYPIEFTEEEYAILDRAKKILCDAYYEVFDFEAEGYTVFKCDNNFTNEHYTVELSIIEETIRRLKNIIDITSIMIEEEERD